MDTAKHPPWLIAMLAVVTVATSAVESGVVWGPRIAAVEARLDGIERSLQRRELGMGDFGAGAAGSVAPVDESRYIDTSADSPRSAAGADYQGPGARVGGPGLGDSSMTYKKRSSAGHGGADSSFYAEALQAVSGRQAGLQHYQQPYPPPYPQPYPQPYPMGYGPPGFQAPVAQTPADDVEAAHVLRAALDADYIQFIREEVEVGDGKCLVAVKQAEGTAFCVLFEQDQEQGEAKPVAAVAPVPDKNVPQFAAAGVGTGSPVIAVLGRLDAVTGGLSGVLDVECQPINGDATEFSAVLPGDRELLVNAPKGVAVIMRRSTAFGESDDEVMGWAFRARARAV